MDPPWRAGEREVNRRGTFGIPAGRAIGGRLVPFISLPTLGPMQTSDVVILVLGLLAAGLVIVVLVTLAGRDALRSRASGAEAALAARERDTERQRRLVEVLLGTIGDGLLLLDGAGDIVFANHAVATHLGSTPSALGAILPLPLRREIAESQRTRTARSVVVEVGAPSRWLGGSITPALDDHTLVVLRDVTEDRRLEAVRRDFVENASHELKTPAATIQATAETLRGAAADDPAEIPRFAARLERESLRLSRIVADLLDLSRLESGGSTEGDVSLAAIARDECGRLRADAEAAGVTLELVVEGPGTVRGSAQDLSLLVRNLIDNAIRYSPEGGTVIVEVLPDDGRTAVRVRDTGLGIPTRDLSRIFERFYRVDRARSRATGGTGLGLAIVKHVVENHGGRTNVQSELGRGSTFEVTFPAAETRR